MYYEEGKYRKIFECLVFNVFKVFQAWSKSQLFKGETDLNKNQNATCLALEGVLNVKIEMMYYFVYFLTTQQLA